MESNTENHSLFSTPNLLISLNRLLTIPTLMMTKEKSLAEYNYNRKKATSKLTTVQS
jgi:hypothetical protein